MSTMYSIRYRKYDSAVDAVVTHFLPGFATYREAFLKGMTLGSPFEIISNQ